MKFTKTKKTKSNNNTGSKDAPPLFFFTSHNSPQHPNDNSIAITTHKSEHAIYQIIIPSFQGSVQKDAHTQPAPPTE